jgi:hypothetical protein
MRAPAGATTSVTGGFIQPVDLRHGPGGVRSKTAFPELN